MEKLLTRCEAVQLTLNLKKCEILRDRVLYLGYVVTAEGLKANPAKVEIVKNHPTPKTKKQLQSFLGMINYYRRFIKDVAKITSPLNKLLQKNVRFIWDDECEQAFRKLIEALVSDPILGFPDFEEEFTLHTDACERSIGYVLSQVIDKTETAIAFGGRALNSHEMKYPTFEKEALAVIAGIKHYHHYLYGRHFTVYTDNTAVTWLYSQKEPKGRVARWIMYLLQYDFDIKYRQGALNAGSIKRERRWSIQDTRRNESTSGQAFSDKIERRADKGRSGSAVTNQQQVHGG